MGHRSEKEASFLNVDLDIEAPYDFAALVSALGEQVFDLHTGLQGEGFQAHLELSGDAIMPKDAEAAIEGFLGLLACLTPDARRLWDGATKRDFNVGIQGGVGPLAFELALLPETLEAVGQLGARVVVTVYGNAADPTVEDGRAT